MSEKWYVVLKKLLKPWTKTLNNFVQYLIILSQQNTNKRQAPPSPGLYHPTEANVGLQGSPETFWEKTINFIHLKYTFSIEMWKKILFRILKFCCSSLLNVALVYYQTCDSSTCMMMQQYTIADSQHTVPNTPIADRKSVV